MYASTIASGRLRPSAEVATAREIAEAMDCAFLDLYESWAALCGAGCDAATAFGLMADSLHPSQLGHDEIAARVRQIVLGTGD